MVSWHPKRSKHVTVLPSLHNNANITESSKPEIVEFYNNTKACVNALDQKVRHYSTYRKTYRQPLTVFYNILDISANNAYILCQMRPPVAGKDGSSRARFKFLCVLGDELIKPNMQLRAQYPKGLNLPTTNAIRAFSIQITNQKIQRLDEHLKRDAAVFAQEGKIEKLVNNAANAKNMLAKNIQRNLLRVMIVLDLVKIKGFKNYLDIFG